MRHRKPTARRIEAAHRKERASKGIEYMTRNQKGYTKGLLPTRQLVTYWRHKRSVLDVLRGVPADPWKRERRSTQR